MLERKAELWIAVVMLVLGLVAVLIWIPSDSQTPAVYTYRRQTQIGDAFLPQLAMAAVALCAAIHGVLQWRRPKTLESAPPLDGHSLAFLALLAGVMASAMVLMFWAGPLAWALLGDGSGYREVRGDAPWKYIGFLLGGTWMTWGLMAAIEGHFSRRRLVAAFLFTLLLIAVFDLPFDSLLLPPNGDW
ncbi:hypothetical protein KM176_16060 [Pseudooceanicola sp. CBS1P-1]|uniref:Tripartite tricarboxylate transporter TctB family protein n=1 Tax=Pseudooceanicola albus TaxID=2692189 RepID=A0A6L7G7U2_9RHOB|nr:MULTISPECIES: hypothetical protein [Pseudooceanicola]MBT9385388.1 hypothetical protein [Pseudooceanicola endophyticus]MXN18753.1 hypothetical protein [Pseudooceanicola albus]